MTKLYHTTMIMDSLEWGKKHFYYSLVHTSHTDLSRQQQSGVSLLGSQRWCTAPLFYHPPLQPPVYYHKDTRRHKRTPVLPLINLNFFYLFMCFAHMVRKTVFSIHSKSHSTLTVTKLAECET